MIKLKTIKSSLTGRTSVALSSLALGTALLLSTTAPLYATDTTVANGDTLPTLTMANGDTLTIQAGGTIDGSTNPFDAIAALGNVTIDNAGTIITTTSGRIAIFHQTGTLNLFNHATGAITGPTSASGFGAYGAVVTFTNLGSVTGAKSLSTITLINLTNSGTIIGSNVGVEGTAEIIKLTNTGTITGGNNAVETPKLTSLTNSGTIKGGDDAVFVSSDITSLTNSGTIDGVDEGVFAGSDITSLTNTGTIKGGDYAVLAARIKSLVNSGTITGGNNGVGANDTLTSLINTGTITGANDGILVVKLVSLINSGTITGTGDAVQAAQIVKLTNSGKITGGTFSILETGVVDTLLTLLPGSNISGAIDLGGGTNTLVIGTGLSADLTFATLPQVITSNGAPVVTNGTRVVTVDTTALAQQDDLVFDISSGIMGTVFSQLNNQGSAGGSAPALSYAATSSTNSAIEANFGDDSDDNDFRMWAKVFGSHRVQQGAGTAADASHNIGGFVIGLDSQLDSSTSLGAFFGASKTSVETFAKQQQSDVKSYFGGVYTSFTTDSFTINAGITGGKTDHDGTRLVDNNQINGVETAARTFNGTFVAPEIAVSTQYNVGGTTLQPTVSVGYTGMFLDGYTETGSSAPLTIGKRNLHLLHARLEVAALLGSTDYSFTPYAGIEARSLIGGDTVDATLLGQNLSFTPGGNKNIASLFLGTRVSIMQSPDFNIFAGFEASYDTEQSSTIAGNVGFKWQF